MLLEGTNKGFTKLLRKVLKKTNAGFNQDQPLVPSKKQLKQKQLEFLDYFDYGLNRDQSMIPSKQGK
jgi:hypothetical protein